MRSHIREANLLEQLTESTSDVRVTTGSDLSDAESAHNTATTSEYSGMVLKLELFTSVN